MGRRGDSGRVQVGEDRHSVRRTEGATVTDSSLAAVAVARELLHVSPELLLDSQSGRASPILRVYSVPADCRAQGSG